MGEWKILIQFRSRLGQIDLMQIAVAINVEFPVGVFSELVRLCCRLMSCRYLPAVTCRCCSKIANFTC